MWMSEISEIMYTKCRKNDKKEYWENITASHFAYLYCCYVKNRPEVRQHIIHSYYAELYCEYVDDDPEVRKHIKDSKNVDK